MKRAAITLLLLLVMIPAAAVAFGSAILDSGTVRARLAAAVERATGHALRLDGPLRLAWSLTPTIEIRQATLLNPPGFPQPDFASVERVEARLNLAALFLGRVEVASLTLEAPQVALDRNADGRGNWERPPAPSQPSAVRSDSSTGRTTVNRLVIENGRLSWLGEPLLTVNHLTAEGSVDGDLTANGVPFKLTGQVAPNAHPMELTATGTVLTATLTGEPGGTWHLHAAAADLAAAGPLFARRLPPLRDVDFTGQYGPAGPVGLHLTIGGSELAPNLRLVHVEATAPALDKPVRLVADLKQRNLPVSLTVDVETLSALLGRAPVPFTALATTDDASAKGQGTLTRNPPGLEMTLAARVKDVQRLGYRAGLALPKLQDAALDVRLAPAPGGAGLLARGLRLTARGTDLSGDLTLGFAPRPSIRGSLTAQTIDLGPWLTLQAPPAPPPTAPTPAGPAAASTPAPGPRLPFDALRRVDADLTVAVAQALLYGTEYRSLEARLLVQDGKLRLDPVQALSPDGPIKAQLLADATSTPPTASLSVVATALPAAPVAAAFGAPNSVTGPLDIDIQLRAAGADAAAMLATLDGHAGIALVDGEVDNHALLAVAGSILKAANVPVDAESRNKVRCLALRIDAAAGQLALRALALDATRLKLDGEGTLNLVDQTLDLNLRPTLRIGGTGIAVPVRLTGPIRAPVAALARGVIAPGRLGISIGGASPDPCPAALLAARDGRQGALPR